MVVTGIGTDVHFFTDHPGRRLVLCGFPVAGHRGVEADSDGDVALHALCNALSSAIGGKSMGYYVQDAYKRGVTDSTEYVRGMLPRVSDAKRSLVHVAFAFECVSPRIDPLVEPMKSVLAPLLGIAAERIGITASQGGRDTDRIRVTAVVTLES